MTNLFSKSDRTPRSGDDDLGSGREPKTFAALISLGGWVVFSLIASPGAVNGTSELSWAATMAAARSNMAAPNDSRSDYMLATGSEAAHRLRLLDEIFGPGTRELLDRAGLAPGMRVAEIGCGTGLVALWIARQVTQRGSVAAVDMSSEQLAVAKRNAEAASLRTFPFTPRTHTIPAYRGNPSIWCIPVS